MTSKRDYIRQWQRENNASKLPAAKIVAGLAKEGTEVKCADVYQTRCYDKKKIKKNLPPCPPLVCHKNTLAIISCYFNDSDDRRSNFHTFKKSIEGLPFFCVELSFTKDFHTDSFMRIKGNSDNLLWQKERLLNICLENLPSQYNKIAWIDADVVFTNPNWFQETEAILDNYALVHLWENAEILNKDGDVENVIPSTRNKGKHCGFAWAARRDVFSHGFYDCDPSGIADLRMYLAAIGKFNHIATMNMNLNWRRHYLRWAAKTYDNTRGRVSYVKGTIKHLYHNRNFPYDKINRGFNTFQPEDMAVDSNGVWKWASWKWIPMSRRFMFYTDDKNIKPAPKSLFGNRFGKYQYVQKSS